MNKKFCTLLLLLVFCFSLVAVTGCSQEEKDFLQLISEMNNLNIAEGSGEITLSLNYPQSLLSTVPEADRQVLNLLQKGVTIKYTSKQDVEKNMFDCSMAFVDKATGNSQGTIQLFSKNSVIYLNVDELIKFTTNLNPQLGKELKDVFGNNVYLSLNKDEYLQLIQLSDPANTGSAEISANMLRNSNFVDTRASRVLQNFILGLADVYKDYQPNLVTKTANGYTLTLNGKQIVESIPGFLKYSLNNIETLGTFITKFLDQLSADDLNALGLAAQQKEHYKASVQGFCALLQTTKDAFSQQIDLLQTNLTKDPEQLKALDGFVLKYTIKENAPNAYALNYDMQMNIMEGGQKIGFSMNSQNTLAACTAFDVTVPTANVMSFTELQKLISKTMTIAVDQNTGTYTDRKEKKQEQIDAHIIDNYTYLPLRQIAKTFGETVDWDAAQSKAYVIKGFNKIDMTGTIINNRTYVKIRDFSKLGYHVDWNNLTRTVTITKIF